MDGAVNNLAVLNSTNDRTIAETYRKDMHDLASRVADLINEARKSGLEVGFQIARDEFGNAFVPRISVVKPL